jgi:hypothetical protein
MKVKMSNVCVNCLKNGLVFNSVKNTYFCSECKQENPYIPFEIFPNSKTIPFLNNGSGIDEVDDAIIELVILAEIDEEFALDIADLISARYSEKRIKNEEDI